MIQLNLLPDVKLEYIKAQKMRRLVTAISIIGAAVALIVFVITLSITLLQKQHLNALDEDIASKTKELKGIQGIDRILTVQNQLATLPGLHDMKPAVPRMFTYLYQLTPDGATISSTDVDFTAKTMTITGNADSLATVNKFVDTLKFTDAASKDAALQKAFSNIVLSSFGVGSETDSAKAVTYTITTTYLEDIFNVTKEVTLIIPKDKVTTRSAIDKPTAIFQAAPVQLPKNGGTQ